MDTVPHIRQAGIAHVNDLESTAACLQPDLDPSRASLPPTTYTPSPSTDPDLYRYRRTFQQQPGLRFIHPGLTDLTPPGPADIRHGVRSDYGSRAGDTFQQQPESEMGEWIAEQKESLYRSSIREPIGRGYVRGHSLPEYTKKEDYRFGQTSDKSESAKNIIYYPSKQSLIRKGASSSTGSTPLDSLDQFTASATSPRSTEPSHGSMNNLSLAEERLITRPLDRHYDWKNVKKETHRFGLANKEIDLTGKNAEMLVKQEVGPKGDVASGSAPTTIVSKKVEQVREHHNDKLGRGRFLRGDVANLPPNHTFGKANSFNDWGARDCLRGDYPPSQQLPDPDLGRSTRIFATTTPSTQPAALPPALAESKERVYGVPSIRADVKAPRVKSVANNRNYGDESDGKGLLYPSAFAWEGVNEEDFLKRRSEEEIREVFKRIGVTFQEDEFNQLLKRAEVEFGVVSVDSFRHAWNKTKLEQQQQR